MLEINKKTLRNILLVVLGCIVFYWLLHETERVNAVFSVIKGITAPFVMGATIAFILNVPTKAFEHLLKGIKKPKLKRLCAVLLTFVAVLLILTLVFWLLIPQLVDTIHSLIPKLLEFVKETETKTMAFLENNPQLMQWIWSNTDLESVDWASLAEKALTIVGNSLSAIVSGAFLAIGSVAGVLMDIFIGLVFAVYCLFQKETLARQGRKLLYAFLPENVSDRIVGTMRLANTTFSNFLSGQCLEVCILGCLFAVTMAILKMPYIPLVSVLVAVTAFVPIVGAWVGCIFGAFLILVANPAQAVLFVIMFIILQQVENNLIYPRVVGTSIGLSGMWVLIAVAVGGELMGVVGMFLMIPVTSVVYTVMSEITYNRLNKRNIPAEKLKDQPPEQSRIRKKLSHAKQKRVKKAAPAETKEEQ